MRLLAEEAVGLICPVEDKYFLAEGRVYGGGAVSEDYVAIVDRPIKVLDEIVHAIGFHLTIEKRGDEVVALIFAWLDEAAGGAEKDE